MTVLAAIELLRILMDQENLPYEIAFEEIISKMFSCNIYDISGGNSINFKISVDILDQVLPRHLELIYHINYCFLQDVQSNYPNQGDKMQRLSFVEEGTPKIIRMNHLIFYVCHKINSTCNVNLLDLPSPNAFIELNAYMDSKL